MSDSREHAEEDYGLATVRDAGETEAPVLPYEAPRPKSYAPAIGLIGCGGISGHHLDAYRTMGLNVAALCDIDETNAREKQQKYFPDAEVYTDYKQLLARDDIEVVDAATHPEPRVAIIEAALDANKHVLSQKPFVIDLDEGRRLCELAEESGVWLAVNQNGRWAPHFSYMRHAIAAGHIGAVSSVHVSMQWDHSWTADTPFNDIYHLLLYDFAIHWFDITAAFLPERKAESVSATVRRMPAQKPDPPMLAHVLIDFADAQATLSLNGHVQWGQRDSTVVCGDKGTLRSEGPSLQEQSVALYTEAGRAVPKLEGTWFTSGFQGAMGELLCAIEENRAPYNNARDNLKSLALCFAALASADDNGNPKIPGAIKRIPKS